MDKHNLFVCSISAQISKTLLHISKTCLLHIKTVESDFKVNLMFEAKFDVKFSLKSMVVLSSNIEINLMFDLMCQNWGML